MVMFASIADSSDESRQIASLHELNMVLSMGSGNVKVGELTPMLVKQLNTSSNHEVVLLACRALNTIIDINPRACELILPAVGTLCEKLLNIDDIDVAEQSMKCLSLLAMDHARFVFDAGGLAATTLYFDFFPQHIQRMALSACVNLCECVGTKADVTRLLPVLPFLSKCLAMDDEHVSQKACQCLCRIIDNSSPRKRLPMSASFHRSIMPPSSSSASHPSASSYSSSAAGGSSASASGAGGTGKPSEPGRSSSANSGGSSSNGSGAQGMESKGKKDSGGRATDGESGDGRAGAGNKSGDGQEKEQEPEYWRAGFFRRMAEEGLIYQWIRMLQESNGSTTYATKTQILTSLVTLLELAPGVLPLLYENEGVEVLHKLLAEYTDPGKAPKGGSFASPAFVTALLQLVKTMLPAPDAMAKTPVARQVKESSTATPKTLKRLPPKEKPMELVSLDSDSAISLDAMSVGGDDDTVGTPKPCKSPAAACTETPASSASALAAAALVAEWSCPACTFINMGASKVSCEVCGTMNPHRTIISSPSRPKRTVKDMEADLQEMEFDAESAGYMSIIDVYAEEPLYYNMYADGLMAPLLKLALQTSSRAVTQHVFSVLASLHAHHLSSLSAPGVASDVSAVIMQNLIHDDSDSVAQSVDLARSLLSSTPGLYKEHFLRHGIMTQIALLYEARAARKPPSSQSGSGSSSITSHRRHNSSTSRSRDAGKHKTSDKVLLAASKFFAGLTPSAALQPPAEGATSGGAGGGGGGGGKKRRRPIDEERAVHSSGPPAGMDLESGTLKGLRTLATTLLSLALSEEQKTKALSLMGKRHRDGRGRAASAIEVSEHAMALEPMQSLAKLINEGVTIFELKESGILDALAAFLYSCVERGVGQKNEGDGDTAMIVDADRERALNTTVDRFTKLYAFVSAFSRARSRAEGARKGEGGTEDTRETVLEALVSALHATLNSIDALPSVRHGGEALQWRYKTLIRPFRLRFREQLSLPTSASSDSASSSQPSHVSVNTAQVMCYSFLAEPLTTIAQVRRYIETQARNGVQRYREETRRSAAEAAAAAAKSKEKEKTETSVGGSGGAVTQADVDQGASSSALRRSAAEQTNEATQTSSAKSSSASLKRPQSHLEVDTAVEADSGQDTKRPMLRRSPRVEKAQQQQGDGGGGMAQPDAPLKEPRSTRSGSRSSAVCMSSSSSSTKPIASRTRSHEPRLEPGLEDSKSPRSSHGASAGASAAQASSSESAVVADKGKRAEGAKPAKKRGRSRAPTPSTDKSGSTSAAAQLPTLPPRHGGRRTRSTRSSSSSQLETEKPGASSSGAAGESASEGKCAAAGDTSTTRPPSPKDIPDTEGGASAYPLRSRKGDSTDLMFGTKVFSCFNVRGQKLWYEGRVTASTAGTVDVLYEDGERRAGMPRVHVQLSVPQDAVLFKQARRSLGLPPNLGSGLLRDVPLERLGGKSEADARSKSDKGSGRVAASSEGSGTSGGAIRSSAPAASAGGSAADDRRLFGLMGDHDYSDEDDMAFSAFGTTGSRSSSSTISSKLPAKTDENREGSSVSASASGNAASGSSSVAAAAAPRAPRPSYQRSVMYPTFILRRRFAGLDVVHDQEHAGLVLQQLGLSAGMSPYDRPLIDAYTVEEMPSSKQDTTTTFTRRMQNLKAIMENLGPAKVARKPSSVSSSAASISVKKTMRVTNVRLTLDDVSVSLASLPETVTTFEVVQCLLWARAESRAKRGFQPPGVPGVPLTHRDMSIEERDWVEAVMIDFDFEAQCEDAGAPSVAISADGLRAAAAGSSSGSPSACATDEVIGAEGGVEGGKAAAAAVQRPADMDVVEPRHPKLHTTLLACGCTTLDASVQSRGSVDLAPLTHQRSATTDVKKRREWRETSVDSSIVRSVLRLLRMLRLVCRYMERATSSGSGEASAASEQDLATAVSTVDWRKVAADCTLRSLSRKLMAQLQDPVAVLSETWPEWCDRVAMDFAELVPLDVRMQYFHCTTFNHARSLHLLQEQAQRLQSGASADSNASGAVVLSPLLPPMHRTVNLSDYVTRFGRLRRRKILLPRENMLEAGIAAFNAAIEENASQSACAHAVHHDEDDDDAGEEDPVDEGAEEPEEQPEGIEEEGDVKPEAKAEGEEGRHGEEGVSTAEGLEGGVKEDSGASAGEGVKGGDEESDVEEDQAGEGQEQQQQEEHHGDDEHDDEEEEEGGGGGAYVRTPGTFRDAILVVDFENETGHGTGPTQEFFSLICRELMRRGLGLWRGDADATRPEAMETDDDAYLDCGACGLFPAVLSAKDKRHADDMDRRLGKFRFMGRVIAKALQDNRLLDLPLSEALCKLLVGHPLTLADVSSVDRTLGRSLSEMQRMATNPQVSRAKLRDYVDSLHLDFTLPGAEWYDLKEGGSKLQVTVDNVTEYVTLVAQHVLVDSVREPLEALVAGIEDVFPINALKAFGPEELQRLLCGGHEEDWGAETIERSLICKHGYTRNSSHIQSLVRVMASFEKDQRKKFLMFITGTPRLPIGGFTALKPNLTVVRKDVPPGSAVDDYLPSCSTCQVYLKLPPYSAESVMRKKLHQAMTLGQNHFALD